MFTPRNRAKERLLNNSEDQYIFYNQNQQHILKYELQIHLQSNLSRKFCVVVDSKSTLNFLSIKICDSLGQFPEFSNIEGLKLFNMHKKTDKGLVEVPLNNPENEIKDYFENGEIVVCEVRTDEYWIQTGINIYSKFKNISVSLELKLSTKMTFNKLKHLLLKTGSNFWLDYCKFKDNLHYVCNEGRLKSLKSKINFDYEISDLSIESKGDELTIGDILDFNSEIVCNLRLIPIEEIYFNKFKFSYLNSEKSSKLRLEDLHSVSFEKLMNEKNYSEEFEKLNRTIRKKVKNSKANNRGNICFYSKLPNNLKDFESEGEIIDSKYLVILPHENNINKRDDKSSKEDLFNHSNLEVDEENCSDTNENSFQNFDKKTEETNLDSESNHSESIISIENSEKNPKNGKNFKDLIHQNLWNGNKISLKNELSIFLNKEDFDLVFKSTKLKINKNLFSDIKIPQFRNVARGLITESEDLKIKESTEEKPQTGLTTKKLVLILFIIFSLILLIIFLLSLYLS